MRVEIDTKFSIGNLVRKYREVKTYNNDIVCPLCGGKHVVESPVSNAYDDDDFDEDEIGKLYCPHCNEEGYIKGDYTMVRELDDEVYRIDGIHIHVQSDGAIHYSYSLQSTPELNNRSHIYCSCYANENELELYEAIGG